MFGLRLNLAELEKQSAELVSSMDAKIDELAEKTPQIKTYLDKVSREFTEMPFMPLDVWERELGDLLS
jgi:hypothetical protein